jgi:uncharacterized membrane protein
MVNKKKSVATITSLVVLFEDKRNGCFLISHSHTMPMESSFVDTSRYQLDPGSWQETIHDVWIGILVGGAHNVYAVKKVCWDFVFKPLAMAMGMRIQEQQRHTGNSELKVIGVGFGRTGTVRF